jgi:hypothetical protein
MYPNLFLNDAQEGRPKRGRSQSRTRVWMRCGSGTYKKRPEPRASRMQPNGPPRNVRNAKRYYSAHPFNTIWIFLLCRFIVFIYNTIRSFLLFCIANCLMELPSLFAYAIAEKMSNGAAID